MAIATAWQQPLFSFVMANDLKCKANGQLTSEWFQLRKMHPNPNDAPLHRCSRKNSAYTLEKRAVTYFSLPTMGYSGLLILPLHEDMQAKSDFPVRVRPSNFLELSLNLNQWVSALHSIFCIGELFQLKSEPSPQTSFPSQPPSSQEIPSGLVSPTMIVSMSCSAENHG